MAIFMIERQFAERLEIDPESLRELHEVNDDEHVRWLYSFLSADKRRTFCLYEADSAEAIHRAAQRAGIPADLIVEVTHTLTPDGASHALAKSLG